MAEEMTPGEIRRSIERIEREQATNAREMVPAKLYETAHQALIDRLGRHEQDARDAQDRLERDVDKRFVAAAKEIAALAKAFEDHEEAHQDRASWSRSKTLTVITTILLAAATIAGAWIAAVLASKGVH